MKRGLGAALILAVMGVAAPATALPSGAPPVYDSWSITDGVYPHDSTLNLASGGPGSPMRFSTPPEAVVDLNGFHIRLSTDKKTLQFVWTSPHSFRAFPRWDLAVKVSAGDRTVSVGLSQNGNYSAGAFWRTTATSASHRCGGTASAIGGGTALINVPTLCFGPSTVYVTVVPSGGGARTVTYALTTNVPTPIAPGGPSYAKDDIDTNGQFPSIWVGYPAP